MNINVQVIKHKDQRYTTAGDWYLDSNGTLQVRVSILGNRNYESLVAVHEIVEALLCIDCGIGQEQVDEFDMAYKGDGEPGDEPNSPYKDQHCFATSVERMLCAALGVPWREYDEAVESL